MFCYNAIRNRKIPPSLNFIPFKYKEMSVLLSFLNSKILDVLKKTTSASKVFINRLTERGIVDVSLKITFGIVKILLSFFYKNHYTSLK